jgi:uncharacterized membrane protein
MNAAHHATIYSQKAQECYIAYAETKDARDAAMYKDRARHYEVLAQNAKESAQRDAVQVEAAQPVAVEAPAKVEAQPAKTRCPHRKLIARFFAIAREAGLDASKAAKPSMRHAMENAMKRCVDSRSEVTAAEWLMLGDLIKAGRLAW